MGVYYHPRHAISRELSPQLGLIRQIAPKYKKLKKLKIIDKVEQSVYIGVSKGAEFKNSIYFVLRSLLHCVWAWFLFEVSSIRQIVVGWIFRNIRPCYLWRRIRRLWWSSWNLLSTRWLWKRYFCRVKVWHVEVKPRMRKQTRWLYKLCMVVWISTEGTMCLLKTRTCFFFSFTSCINGR